MFCPKSAKSFNSRPITDSHAADWCRRAYRAGSVRCEGCELGRRLGVVVEKRKEEVCASEQLRLF